MPKPLLGCLLALLFWPNMIMAQTGLPTPIPSGSESAPRQSPEFRAEQKETLSPRSTEANQAEPESVAQQVAEEIANEINQLRVRAGLAPLRLHPALSRAALRHSQEMLTLGYFSHQSPTPGRSSVGDRISAEGVRPRRYAENIFGCEGVSAAEVPRRAVEEWMQSPGHRRNILDPTFTHTGLGVVERNGEMVITQVFGAGM